MDSTQDIKDFLNTVRNCGRIIGKHRLSNWTESAKFDGVRIEPNGSVFAKFILPSAEEHVFVPTEYLSASLNKVEETCRILVEIPIVLNS